MGKPDHDEVKSLPKNPLWAVLRYIISFAIGLAIFLGYIFGMNVTGQETQSAMYKILADGATISGVVLMGIGLLVLIANNGMFNFLNYVVQRLLSKFIHTMKAGTQAYGDFVAERGDKKFPYLFLIIPGAVFLLLTAVFTIAFYAVR